MESLSVKNVALVKADFGNQEPWGNCSTSAEGKENSAPIKTHLSMKIFVHIRGSSISEPPLDGSNRTPASSG